MLVADRWLKAVGGATQEELAAGSTSAWVELEQHLEIPGTPAPVTPYHGYPDTFRMGNRFYDHRSSESQMSDDTDIFNRQLRNVMVGGIGSLYDEVLNVGGTPPSLYASHESTYGPNPDGDDYHDHHRVEVTTGMYGKHPWALHPADSLFNESWLPDVPNGAIGYEAEVAEVAPGVYLPLAKPVWATVQIPVYGSISTAYPNLQPTGSGFAYSIRANTNWRSSGTLDIHPDGYWVGEATSPQWTFHAAYHAKPSIGRWEMSFPDLRAGDERQNMDDLAAIIVTAFADDASPYLGVFALWESIDPQFAYGLDSDYREIIIDDPIYGPGSASVNGRGVKVEASGASDGRILYVVQPPRFRWIYGEASEPVTVTGSVGEVRRRFNP